MATYSNRPALVTISNLFPSKKDARQRGISQEERQIQHIKVSNEQAIKNATKDPHRTPILQKLHWTVLGHLNSDVKGQGTDYSCSRQIDDVHGTVEDKKTNRFSFSHTSVSSNSTQYTSSNHKRRHSSEFSSYNHILKFWKFSRSVRRESGAIVLQAYCRMFLARLQYKRMKSAATKIQRCWRQFRKNKNVRILFSDYNRSQRTNKLFLEQLSYPCNQASIIFPQAPVENVKVHDDFEPLQSPVDLLYKGDISPSEEEKLLTELAGLLSVTNDDCQEGCDLSKGDMPYEEPGNFQFPLLQRGGESEKGTPVLTRIHSPRRKGENCTSVEKEKRVLGEIVDLLPEWSERRKLDFMEMEGSNRTFMSMQMGKIFTGITDLFPRGISKPSNAGNREVSPANDDDQQSCLSGTLSDYFFQEGCSKNFKSGLDHLSVKDIDLDEVSDVSSHTCADDETINQIWARNVSFMERRGKAGLLYYKLLGRTEVEWKMPKVILDDNSFQPTQFTSLDCQKDFIVENGTDRVLRASLNDWQSNMENESVLGGFKADENGFLELMGKRSHLEPFDHEKNIVPVQYPDPPLSGATMFACLFPEASISSSAIEVLCLDVDSKKKRASPVSEVQKNVKASPVPLSLDMLTESPRTSSSSSYAQASFDCNILAKGEHWKRNIDMDCRSSFVHQLSNDFAAIGISPQCHKYVHTDSMAIQQLHPHVIDQNSLTNAPSCALDQQKDLHMASLLKLCKLWDDYNIDLLTRSLKYKNLENDGISIIQCEVDRTLTEGNNARHCGKAKELIKKQRDIIYANIMSVCGMCERYQLYSTWGIQKVSTGCLHKIVYDLLWIEPMRYRESADLVTKYLQIPEAKLEHL
eukprot:Gb_32158 [translate_table: standard]